MASCLIEVVESFFITLLHPLATEVLPTQGVAGEGIILLRSVPKPPGGFLVILCRTMAINVALSDPIPQVSLLLCTRLRSLKGFQSIHKPPLCFFLILLTPLSQQVHPSDVVAGIAVSTACFQEKQRKGFPVIGLRGPGAKEVSSGLFVVIRPPVPAVSVLIREQIFRLELYRVRFVVREIQLCKLWSKPLRPEAGICHGIQVRFFLLRQFQLPRILPGFLLCSLPDAAHDLHGFLNDRIADGLEFLVLLQRNPLREVVGVGPQDILPLFVPQLIEFLDSLI